ncbi:MAG TPA: fructose-bisphosphatase class II, partial [Anaeromyxobacteraceae bacterium]|nr:fructose-bisphosphatase class II [Anaeromyxobacteraceae bacterium]
MDRNLALEVVRVTEAAALASARLMGRGDRDGADRAAVEAMRQALGDIAMTGEVIIGQGERGQASMLFVGEKVGRARQGDPETEIAVDALEGTKLCATGAANAISVIAMAEKGKFLRAPDLYMEKIAVGPGGYGSVDLTRPPRDNLRRIADALGKYIEDLTVVILDRPRNERLVGMVRETGARIKLIGDGDLAGALSTCFPE